MYNIDWSVIVFGDTADNCSSLHWPTTHHSARARSCVKTGRNKDNKHKTSKYNSIQRHVAKSRNTQDSIPVRHINSRRSCQRNETTGRHIIKVDFPSQPKSYSKTWQQLSYKMCYSIYSFLLVVTYVGTRDPPKECCSLMQSPSRQRQKMPQVIVKTRF